jgi:hypothetical protein
VAPLNRLLTALFDAVLGPLDRLPPMAGLVVLSLVTAVAVLFAFKWTADQQALLRSKRGMQAAVFEMRLFNDDLAALFRAQGDVLRHTLGYLRHSFAPTLWLLLPMVLLMIHMEFHYGYAGLAIGEPALVTLRFVDGAALPNQKGTVTGSGGTGPALEAPKGIAVETPGVMLPSAREIVWRIRPHQQGAYELRVQLPAGTVEKTLLVSDAVGRRSPKRPGDSILQQFLYPSERPVISPPGIAEFAVAYPAREVKVAGWNVGWSGVYLGLTLLFAFALKRPFGVEM